MKRRFRAWYGESPLHLAVMLASFALCGYALVRLLADQAEKVAGWLVGAAVLHDLLVVPLYAGADWLLHRTLLRRAGREGARREGARTDRVRTDGTGTDRATPARPSLRVAAVQHIRVPAFVSLVLLLVYWPLISGAPGPHYRVATLLAPGVFPMRWLLITAVLFAVSGAVLALRVRRAARAGRRVKSLRTHGGSGADRPSATPGS